MTMKIAMALALAATAAAAGAQPRVSPPELPIRQGYYVADYDQCGSTASVFRYDGRRIGWYAAERQPHEMEPIRSVRRVRGGVLVEIANREPSADAVTTVMVAPRGPGRIAVEVQEQIPMRLCTPASLPRWMRGR